MEGTTPWKLSVGDGSEIQSHGRWNHCIFSQMLDLSASTFKKEKRHLYQITLWNQFLSGG
jgi:hypothetical protein